MRECAICGNRQRLQPHGDVLLCGRCADEADEVFCAGEDKALLEEALKDAEAENV